MAYARRIRDRLDVSVTRLNGDQSKAELSEIYRQTTGETPGAKSALHVVVVSSLAGGTGAGLLCTVCDILRAMNTDAGRNVFGMLYTPEIFQTLDITRGVQPNSLAAICEVLNGYWWNGAATSDNQGVIVDPKQTAELVRAGLPHPLMGSGPSYPFLVGRVNQGGVDHRTPQGLFSTVGRALLSWVTDVKVQKDFFAFTIGNWQAASMGHLMGPGTLVDQGADYEKGFPAFSALGFARISVGTDYFEDYSARRLVRDGMEHITRFHVDSDLARTHAQKLDTQDPDEIAEALAKDNLFHFLKMCELSERGPEENEILDRLRPLSAEQIYSEFRETVVELTGLGGTKQLPAEAWRQQLQDAIKNAQPLFNNNYRDALEKTTTEWVTEIQEKIVEAVEWLVARYGLKVSSTMCALVARELRGVAEDLRQKEYVENIGWSTNWQTYADDELDDTFGKQLAPNDQRLLNSVNKAVHIVSLIGEAMIAERAAALAEEAANRIFGPLVRALDAALYQAELDLEVAQEWPSWSEADPPESVTPPKSEFPLIFPEDYHARFEELLADSLSEDKKGAARNEIRTVLINGDFLREQHQDGELVGSEDLLCVYVDQDWWPSSSATGGPILKAPVDLGVKVNADLTGLEARTRSWLHRPGSVFGDFLDVSLRAYLGSTGLFDTGQVTEKEYDERRARFDSQLVAATAAAQPLVSIDRALLGIVHPNSEGISRRTMSQLPFAGHPTQEAVTKRLNAENIPDAVIDGLLTNDNNVRHVDITTALVAPHSILVIDSLLRPIAETWEEYVASGNRQTFWARRRARTIDEFAPAPQALIYCMVRGWFTGLLLGQIDRDGEPMKIARSNDDPAEFPHPCLSTGSGVRDHLALVIEALGLAYVMVSLLKILRPLDAYCALRDLGRSQVDAALYTYDHLHPSLARWIDTGLLEDTISEPFLDSGDDPKERAGVLIDLLDQQIVDYTTAFDVESNKWARSAASLSGPPLWTGLWPVIGRELGQLASAARRYAEQLGGGGRQL
jgi:hypothetical protein